MKLNEIKQLDSDAVNLKEGVIPVHIIMTLEQIIKDGQVTNSVQTFVLAGLVDMFKDGGPYRWPRELNAYGMSTMGTSSDMIAAINSLSGSEQAQTAEWLITQLNQIAGYESTTCGQDPTVFLRSILQKTD